MGGHTRFSRGMLDVHVTLKKGGIRKGRGGARAALTQELSRCPKRGLIKSHKKKFFM